jgi:hypothetical protein
MADQVRRVDYYYVEIPDKPGEGARVLAALKEAGINLLNFTAFPGAGGKAQLDLVTDNADTIAKAAKNAGLTLSARKQAFFIQGQNRAGAAGEVLRKLADAKINVAAYRAAIGSEVLRTVLGDRIVADATASTAQKQVQELYIRAPQETPSAGALKVRHILYSPKDDPSGAATVPETDPNWTTAQLAAQAAYDKIKADPKQFDVIARKESDETQDLGDDGTGGKLPYYDKDSPIDEAFKAAIFKDGVKPGDLLPPFKSSFGWHVVQVMYGPPDLDQMTKLRNDAMAGADFGQLVRDNSEGPKAGKGGDLGFVGKGQLDDRLIDRILATPVGSYTDVIDLPNDGLYLFKVVAEKTAAPDAEQLKTIKTDAFSNWYSGKKAAAKITRDLLGG